MRNIVKALFVVALAVPAIASATIANTRHDLSSGSTTPGPKSAAVGGTDQICIFCHTPHRANQQSLIWNHAPALTTGGWTAGQLTVAGTPLPTGLLPKSQVCLTCHDGSISLGSLSSGTVAMNAVDTSAAGNLTNATYQVGPTMGNATSGNHPVSIPYASQTYNGVTSTAAIAGYATVATGAACTSPSGTCTNAAVNGAAIQLFGGAGTAGVECGSCHDVHNALNLTHFLRVTATGSALCLACHIK